MFRSVPENEWRWYRKTFPFDQNYKYDIICDDNIKKSNNKDLCLKIGKSITLKRKL